MMCLAVFAVFYRRRRKQWPWYRLSGGHWRKSSFWPSPSNSVQDFSACNNKSKVLDDNSSSVLGIDSSRARVFKRDSGNGKLEQSLSTSNKYSATYNRSSVATGASSVTLMVPNVIGSDSVAGSSSKDSTLQHIYCELRDGGMESQGTPNSPCYASLPIKDLPFSSPPPPPPVKHNKESTPKATENVYNDPQ